MAEGLVSDKQLIEALLRERDELYRRAVKAERRLEELSDAESMRQQYETRIKEMEADHQKLIGDMEADFQKEFSKKEDEYKIHGSQAMGQDEREAPDSRRPAPAEAGF